MMRPGAECRLNFATSKLLLSVSAMIMFVENGRDEERMETIKWLNLSRTRPVELQTKVKQRFVKISQSQRRPLQGLVSYSIATCPL